MLALYSILGAHLIQLDDKVKLANFLQLAGTFKRSQFGDTDTLGLNCYGLSTGQWSACYML